MVCSFRKSSEICDVSFAGGTFSLDGRMCRAFLDDGFPIRVEEMTNGEVVADVNGKLAFGTRPGLARVTVSVAYGSSDDEFLRRKFDRMQQELSEKVDSYPIKVTDGNGNTTTLEKAFLVSYAPMPSVAGDGRIKAVQYTFIGSHCVD